MPYINENTLFIMKNNQQVEIVSTEGKIVCIDYITKILDESCLYYGSSLDGRIKASKYLTKNNSKVPIIINEKDNLLLFPIYSLRNEIGLWFVYNNIISYRKVNKYVEVTFKNNEKILFLISYNIFYKQILKSGNLLAIYALKK